MPQSHPIDYRSSRGFTIATLLELLGDSIFDSFSIELGRTAFLRPEHDSCRAVGARCFEMRKENPQPGSLC